MKRFAIVFCQEFKEAIRSKPFIIISVFLAVILVLLAAAGFFLTGISSTMSDTDSTAGVVDYTGGGASMEQSGGFAYLYSAAVCDRAGGDTLQRLREQMPACQFRPMELEEEEIEALLTEGDCDAYIVLHSPTSFDIYEQADLYGVSLGEDISAALDRMHKTDMLGRLGVEPNEAVAVLESQEVMYTSYAVGGYDMGGYIYNYIMVILMFLVIGLYGQMVATRVAAEKSSRTMEVLATSVSPAELLCGKVMGVGAAGLLQMGLFIGAALAVINGLIAGVPMLSVVLAQMLGISAFDITCMVLYFILGFLVYAFIFGALGSMVSQIEDLSGVASMPMYVLMAGYMIAMFASLGGESGALMKIASFVPFWSPVVMFSRMTVENVPVVQIVISLLLLVATAAVTAWFSARVYRSGMLRYGKPPRLKEIINAAKGR